jgi:DNA primase
MSLFPQSFVEDVKAQTNIVSIISEATPLKKAGATWKGLCPFHQEKTPSFNVNADKGFFKCFGCGAGGDVVKFVELHQKLSFPEAVRYLAQRASMTVPEVDSGADERALSREREALLMLHEEALAFFREQLAAPAGARARRELESRGLNQATIDAFRYGYAPAGGRDTLRARFESKGISTELQLKSGLVRRYDDGRIVDYFRTRLMVPIARETGGIIAFGGRALEDGQVPKYLNSPETPIYTKSRTLYGLDVTRSAIRTQNYCVLVEGYFDLAQVWQAGVQNVAAPCGTALTAAQARLLKRSTSKVVLSFDPDTAGRAAAARSSELLVAEGFQVNVALLNTGEDPDVFIRKRGARAYMERLRGSQPYLDFLLDRAAEGQDLTRPDVRKSFLDAMLAVAATIPDPALRDQFADRLSHKARIKESVVRDLIREAAAKKKTVAPALAVATSVSVLPAEQGLLWTLVHRPVEGAAALAQLEPEDLEGLLAAPIFRLAVTFPPEVLPELIRERLTEGERALLDRAAASEAPAAAAADCVTTFRRLRIERQLADAQAELDQLQDRGQSESPEFSALQMRKLELTRQLEALSA